MSSENTQRFFILAIIVTLSISVWSGYLYSQTYRISQESKLELEATKKKLTEVDELLSEVNSKLETANELFSEATRRLQKAYNIQKDTEKFSNNDIDTIIDRSLNMMSFDDKIDLIINEFIESLLDENIN